jgi:hypothetical protein
MMVIGSAVVIAIYSGDSPATWGCQLRKPQRGQHFACAIAGLYNGDGILTIVSI